ncbi:hypothetical protein Q31b_20650 [Novipirellula aureliae]|uniref:Uncharacterized protein n=2 Tax=Novipirellula aureliae TaxID=2527966 RepID=A0A5C6E299_9BACT|nr:hypothetical protein Q31b_20650 [Novipirellula aureliae]
MLVDESQRFWFASLAELQIALGLDPLDQAMGVSSLPESRRPGPESSSAPIEVEVKIVTRCWSPGFGRITRPSEIA